MNGTELCARVRGQLRCVEERIRGHAWMRELEASRISTQALRTFAGEQFHIIPSALRSFAMLTDRFPREPAHSYLQGMLEGEQAAFTALEGFAAAVGLDGETRGAYDPIPGCQVYASYVARLAREATPAEVAGAFLVNLDVWGRNCARMQAALQSTYRYTDEACAFFAWFAAPATALEHSGLEVIDAGLARGADPTMIARAAHRLQAYELLYWDSLPC
ncbi:MAG: transcriptional regulator [Egibacteraceae bacterium]